MTLGNRRLTAATHHEPRQAQPKCKRVDGGQTLKLLLTRSCDTSLMQMGENVDVVPSLHKRQRQPSNPCDTMRTADVHSLHAEPVGDSMTLEQLLRDAIATRTAVELSYQGDPPTPRVVHPHALYRTSTGKICIDGYQVAGPTTSGGKLPDWRPFDLAKITSAQPLADTFSIAPGYDPSGQKYANGLLAFI